MLRIALKCHHTQSPHRLSQGDLKKRKRIPAPMFLMPNAGVDTRSHQALTGRTGADASTRVVGLKIPPNFSFARVLAVWAEPRSRGRNEPSCVAKKRSIGGDGAWERKFFVFGVSFL